VSTEREKQVAAEAAADLVEDGMTVGLGTGSTVAFLFPPEMVTTVLVGRGESVERTDFERAVP
jgi:ribose 5-phosphate isomerase